MHFIRKNRIPRTLTTYRGFGGYCPKVRPATGQWFHEENLSTRSYPLLRPRGRRHRLSQEPIQALGSMDDLIYLSRNILHYKDRTMPLPLTEGEKSLLSFGAFVIVEPDMIWVNTVEDTFGFCQTLRSFELSLGILWCDREGNPLEGVVDGQTPPGNSQQYWVDTSGEPGILKAFSQELGLWLPISPTYVRIMGEGIGSAFPKGTSVMIEDCPYLAPIVGNRLTTVYDSGRDHLVLEGNISGTRLETEPLQFRILSPMPKMDYLFHHDNRLWGCRYGRDHNGDFVNEIYASALGDFSSWYSFRGIASDSYVLSLGTEGPFTGGGVVGGYPTFFKEQSIHRIYGTRPSSYQLRSTSCVGVSVGSGKSIAHLDDGVIYLGRDGFYFYDGSLPTKVSGDLEGKTYSHGIGAVLGRVYYGSVLEETGKPVLLTYDTGTRVWHRETGLRPKELLSVKGVLYYRTEEAGLFAIGTGRGEPAEPMVQWEAVSGILREEKSKGGYFTGLRLRVSGEVGSTLSLYAQYDSCGAWEPLGSVQAYSLHSKEVAFRIRLCDHLRLKLRGRGDILLHTMTLEMEG